MFFTKNKLITFFLAILGFVLIHPQNTKAQCTAVLESDSLALVELYNATDGDNWDNNSGWLVEPVAEWYGVTLSDDNCRVSEISLNNNNLIGELLDLNLNNLQYLFLLGNALSGTIPDFTNLNNLQKISLSYNNLSGTIPDFTNLNNLQELSLQSNQLSGTIPDFTNLNNLQELWLWGNQLSGTIPDFTNLNSLQKLNLDNNQLSGNIPDFTNLNNLQELWLWDNQLSGTIPDFTNLNNLQIIDLCSNYLSGTIPDFTNLNNLKNLYLSYNQLSGTIPDFNNLPNLEQLLICPNNLIGAIPSFENCPLLNIDAIDFSCLQAPAITGYAYYDLNNNCIKEDEEPTIPNAFVGTTDNAFGTFTDDNGFYQLKMDIGTYTVNYLPPNYLWEQSCPTNYTETFTEYTNSLGGFDFANEALVECPLMTINIGTPFTRRCFTNTYTVDCCNTGTQAAESVVAEIWFPETIIPLSSSLPYTTNIEGALLFDLETVGIGECQSFTIVDSVSCDAVLGSTPCVEAYITPDDLCYTPSVLWDQSDLIISSVCLGSTVQFTIENIGEDMTTSTEYKMYEDDILVAFEMIQLASGETFEITRDTEGQTFRLTVNQHPGNPYSIVITEVVELCGEVDTASFSLGFVNSQSDEDRSPFYDIDCQEIIGSYDPNDKTVLPTGIDDEHYISENQELEYRIRFQNTGNDTAFTVIVVDTLNTDFLDISTLTLGTSSHDYNFELTDTNVLMFTFSNILLPDSTTNEMASHGFLSFKISQHIDNPIGELIENDAGIYFDYNEAIITNKVFNTIGLPVLLLPPSSSANTVTNKELIASIYLAQKELHIQLPLVKAHTKYTLNLYSLLGQQVAHKTTLSLPNDRLAVGNLSAGIYVAKIQGSDGSAFTSKVLIQ